MSKNKIIFAAILTLLASVGGTIIVLEWLVSKRTMVIEIIESAGNRSVGEIEGEVEVDGIIMPVKEKVPVTLTYQARHIRFAFVATWGNPVDGMRVNVLIDGHRETSAATRNSIGGDIFKPVLFPSWRRGTNVRTFSTGKVGDPAEYR